MDASDELPNGAASYEPGAGFARDVHQQLYVLLDESPAVVLNYDALRKPERHRGVLCAGIFTYPVLRSCGQAAKTSVEQNDGSESSDRIDGWQFDGEVGCAVSPSAGCRPRSFQLIDGRPALLSGPSSKSVPR